MTHLPLPTDKVDIISLFDLSGLAIIPFTKKGYKTLVVDNQATELNSRATYTSNVDILNYEHEITNLAKTAKLVIAFPPCTDLAVSGAKHFKNKAAKNPNFQKEALHLFKSAIRICGKDTPYMIENPIGVVSTMYRKYDFNFNPCDYGGYLPEDDVHPEFPDLIPARDNYTKTTCLWTGNGFIIPEKKKLNILNKGNAHYNSVGGKSKKTKYIRSLSPRGFFVALAEIY